MDGCGVGTLGLDKCGSGVPRAEAVLGGKGSGSMMLGMGGMLSRSGMYSMDGVSGDGAGVTGIVDKQGVPQEVSRDGERC
jgi:hypothetical protein